MAILQTEAIKGRSTPPTGYVAGSLMVARFVVDFSKFAYATTDKVEFGILPGGTRIIRARFIPEGIGTPNLTAGLMSGDVGSPDEARTVGNQLAAAAALTNNIALNSTDLQCASIVPTEVHRPLGLTLSAAVAMGADKRLTAIIEYVH